jgi:hypothetical protein
MFAEGLIVGSGEHFGEALDIDHSLCMHRGDPKCELRISSRRIA